MQTDTLLQMIEKYTFFSEEPITVDTILNQFSQIQLPPKKKDRALSYVSIENVVLGRVIVYTDEQHRSFRREQQERIVSCLANYPGGLFLENNKLREQTYVNLQQALAFQHEELLRVMALGSAYELWSIRSPLSLGRD